MVLGADPDAHLSGVSLFFWLVYFCGCHIDRIGYDLSTSRDVHVQAITNGYESAEIGMNMQKMQCYGNIIPIRHLFTLPLYGMIIIVSDSASLVAIAVSNFSS